MTSTPSSAVDPAGRAARAALAVLVAAVACAIAVSAIAAIAHAAGARHDFKPLTPAAFLPLTTIAVLLGGIGWQIVSRRAAQPAAVLRRLVPIVVLISLIPDIALGVSGGQPGTTWGAVAALMCMHIAVAAIAVAVFHRMVPVR